MFLDYIKGESKMLFYFSHSANTRRGSLHFSLSLPFENLAA
jgi:hypothetical protein